MTLAAGTRLGPYEIQSAIGVGGMGEVYKARDTRLDRSVAIKVLPPQFSADLDRRARFEREAKTIAGLTHPHICTLYDVGEHEGSTFLVMEHLSGETLAQRLAKGALPLEQALSVGTEIADALAAAHRQSVIHRDLKPGNVMLTKAGAKLLDFGLAKLKGHGEQPAAAHLATAPTQSTPLTGEGMIVGTLQYMAPEQLEGKPADARTDLWALGAILYEMVTGKRAFEGTSAASLIASILDRDPAPLSTLQPLTPPALDHVVRGCLAKSPDDRPDSAHDVANELRWVRQTSGVGGVGVPAAAGARRRVRDRLAWATAGVFAALALLLLARVLTISRPAPPEATRFEIAPPPGVTLTWPRVSPDGRTIAFVGSDSRGRDAIWIRPLGSFEAVRLAGTDDVLRPFWSPDSRHLAFFANGQLKKVPAAGGPTQVICESNSGADGSWSPEGVILFDGRADDPIWRVPAGGGVPTVAVERDKARKESGPGWPFFLPDGRHYLFVTFSENRDPVSLKVSSIDRPGTTTLMDIGSRVEYTSGHLLYLSQGTLMARRFSPDTLSFGSDPFPVIDKISLEDVGRVNFSTSQAGDLVFMRQEQAQQSRLVWLDRTGREVGQVGEPGVYRELALSPDQTHLAVGSVTDAGRDIWIHDLRRNTASRFTFEGATEDWPVWSPDGQRLAYGTLKYNGSFLSLAWRASSGTSDEVLVRKATNRHLAPTDWSPDGRSLVVEAVDGTLSHSAVMLVPLSGGAEPAAVLPTPVPVYQTNARLSPDGRWMAYTSNESKRNEVYVQPFPPTGGKWQVSVSGGDVPMWRADGKELFYQGLDDTFYAVPVAATGKGLEAGLPVKLFQRTLQHADAGERSRWAVTRDGQRFLANVVVESTAATPIQVVLHWAASLQRKPR